MGALYLAGVALFVLVSVLLTLVVFIQKGRGGGLIFGSSGGHTVLGTRAPEALFWFTAALFGVFLGLAVVLNVAAQ